MSYDAEESFRNEEKFCSSLKKEWFKEEMPKKFKIDEWVKAAEDISLNDPSNPCMWGIDIKKGTLGLVKKYFKASAFIVLMKERYEVERYEVAFPVTDNISVSAILFERQIERQKICS